MNMYPNSLTFNLEFQKNNRIFRLLRLNKSNNLNKNKMGFLSGMFSAAVKTALTPAAIVKDAVNVVIGEEADTTKSLLESAVEDVSNVADDLVDGELL